MKSSDTKKKGQATLHVGLLADPEMDARVLKRGYLKQGREKGCKEAIDRLREYHGIGLLVGATTNILLEEIEEKYKVIMKLGDVWREAPDELYIDLLDDPDINERDRVRYCLQLGRKEGCKKVIDRMRELLDSGLLPDKVLDIVCEENESRGD